MAITFIKKRGTAPDYYLASCGPEKPGTVESINFVVSANIDQKDLTIYLSNI
jgi:hypothetical protein